MEGLFLQMRIFFQNKWDQLNVLRRFCFFFSFLISIFQTLIKVRISNASAVFSFLLPNHVSELEFLFMAASSYIHEEF